ncbi:MAG TPA: hypothetical protein VFG04_26535 [Planctomycetaceae bacterium]|jgi:hypothetical protein|nr:hypothetical protein [Planctomycetaceae bacterium]
MKTIGWLILAAIGVAVSIWAYQSARPADGFTPIWSGLIVVARTSSQRFDEPIPFPSTKAGVIPLPVSGLAAFLGMRAGSGKDGGRGIRFQLSEKLIDVSLKEAGITESSLAWGKLPRVGRNEVIAGYEVAQQADVQVADTVYKVTGGLGSAAGLFSRSYVLPAEDRTGEHGDESDAGFRPAVLIPLEARQLANRQTEEQLQKRFPPDQFDRAACLPAVGPQAFYASLFGEGLLLLGGSAIFIAAYGALAARVGRNVLRDPLVALSTHRRLIWTVHLVYFGLYLLAAALVYRAPDVRNALQAIIQNNLREGSGLLAFAGKAYLSGNILWAALVTLAVNFLFGSVLYLILPSCVIPGSGALLAGFRAVTWGLLLGPATLQQALVMLPHSGTLLLEGEGYILATFFGLMFAISLFGPGADASVLSRYKRGLVLTVKGSLLVALVLAVAALYEATEVIQMLKNSGAI